MTDVSAEELTHLELIAATLRRRQRVLEAQRARYNQRDVPAHLVLECEDVERQLVEVQARMRRLHPGSRDDRLPYLGLLTFQETNADLFFGREALVADLLEHAQRAPLLAVLGASGSGKSSIVHAGLIPILKDGMLPGSQRWRYLTIKPGARPLDTLAVELAKIQGGDLGSALDLGRHLLESDRALLLAADMLLDRGQRLVLVVDQFEELWTLAPVEPQAHNDWLAQQQRPFIRLLLTAIAAPDRETTEGSPFLIVITMRADFLHRVAELPELARSIGDHDVIVSPMSAAELRVAIEQPAELLGGSFESGLVDELIRQVQGRVGALPLLEYTLLELWKQCATNRIMTWERYRALGGVEGALAARADTILEERYEPARREALRQTLLRLVQPGEGAADTRRRVPLFDLTPAGESVEDVQVLLKPLIDARLLTAGHDGVSGVETVEMAHEALIRAWPTLDQWIGEARNDLRFQLQLEAAAKEWQASGENRDLLWGGLRLSNAEAWLARAQLQLNARDQAFLDASRAAEQAHRDAEEAIRQRELAQARALADEQKRRTDEQSRAARNLRRLLIVSMLTVTTVIVAIYALNQQNIARDQARISLSRELASLSLTYLYLDGKLELGLLLAAEAYRIDNNADTRGSLMVSLEYSPHLVAFLRGHHAGVTGLAFSPDGTKLVSSSYDSTLMLWDVAMRKPIGQPLSGHTSSVHDVAFSPDGSMVVSGGEDRILVWNVATGKPIAELDDPKGPVTRVVFSPDGKLLASGNRSGEVILWDVATWHQIIRLEAHHDLVDGLAFSPHGALLASSSCARSATQVDTIRSCTRGEIRLWDVATHQPLGQPLANHTDRVVSLAFSPDGATLASGSWDKTIVLWDVATRRPISAPLLGHESFVDAVAFSPDGKTLVSGSWDKTLMLWDVATHQAIGQPLRGHTDVVLSVAFSPDGTTLASSSQDGTIIIWNSDVTQRLGMTLSGHTSTIEGIAFNADGTVMISGDDDGAIRIWDLTGIRPQSQLFARSQSGVTSLALNHAGTRLATGGRDGSVILWDIASGQRTSLVGHRKPVRSVAFSPDDATLASGGEDGMVLLWDVASAQSRVLDQPKGTIWSVTFSPDGTTLASGGDDQMITLWDVTTGKPRGAPLRGHTSTVYDLAFSPDGTLLASGSRDRTVILWDVASQKRSGLSLTGYNNSVYAVAFSHDGKTLASGSCSQGDTNFRCTQGEIRLWDVPTRQLLDRPLTSHTDRVYSLAFSPNGQRLASGGLDTTIILWDLDFGALQRQVCAMVSRNLSADEWTRYLDNQPWRATCPNVL